MKPGPLAAMRPPQDLAGCLRWSVGLTLLGTLLTVVDSVVTRVNPAKRPHHEFFENDDVEHFLPMAPKHYPEAFQGIIWMDQEGAYAYSNFPFPSPGLAMSFGDTEYSTWDPKTRTVSIDVTGPSWTWQNHADSYLRHWFIGRGGGGYVFELSEDSSHIQIILMWDLGFLGKWYVPRQLLNFTMERRTPPGEPTCPPDPGSSAKQVAECAHWERLTAIWLSPLLGDFGLRRYYVFKIVDAAGNRVQPYYDRYVAYANSSCKPSRFVGRLLGMEHVGGCSQSYHGARRGSLARPSGSNNSKPADL